MDQLSKSLQNQMYVPPMWEYLHHLRLENKLCDIQLLIRAKHPLEEYVDDFAVADCIQAHKLVLAASSLFFRRCLEKGELLNVYNFDGVQSKNMQLLVDYMYHQTSWQEVEANEEAAEVARILEVIEHDEPMNKMDYPKDLEGNRVLIVKMQDQSIHYHEGAKMASKAKRIIVDDIEAEFVKHDIHGRRRKKLTSMDNQVESPGIITQLDQSAGTAVVTMESVSQIQQFVISDGGDNASNIIEGSSAGSFEASGAQESLLTDQIKDQSPESGGVQMMLHEQQRDIDGEAHSLVSSETEMMAAEHCHGSYISREIGKDMILKPAAHHVGDEQSTIICVKKVEVNNSQSPTTETAVNNYVKQPESPDERKGTGVHGEEIQELQIKVEADAQSEDPLVIIPRIIQKVSTKGLTLDRDPHKYATRFRGQKRVIEILPRRVKRKKFEEENIDEGTGHAVTKIECNTPMDGPETNAINALKVIQLEKINEDDEKGHSGNMLLPSKQHDSAVSALPSLSEHELHLTWNRMLNQSLHSLGREGDVSLSEVQLINRSTTEGEVTEQPTVSTAGPTPSPRVRQQKRGRPRKHVSEEHCNNKDVPHVADESTSLRCHFCGKTFKNCTGLSIHEQWKHGTADAVGQKKETKNKLYTCDFCNKVCGCFQALVQHMRCIHNKAPTHKCDQCDIEFNTKRAYNTHMVREHNTSLYTCKLCETTFKSPEGYKIHMFKKHTEAENAFECSKCGKTFKMKHELAIHLKITHADQRAYKCKLCTRDFKGKAALKRHLQTYHTNIRKVRCPVCSMLFKTNADMVSHHRKHFRNSQPKQAEVKANEHRCSKCNKVFTKLIALVNHERLVHHVRGVGVTYMCTMCEKSYSTKNYLLNHIRQMHLPRRYKCHQCLYEFPYSYMLKKHLPKCKGYPVISKPYRCSRCNRYFNLKGNLTRHMRTIGRCHRAIRNYADYIVMVRSEQDEGLTLEQGTTEEPSGQEEVTLEALQASEALQQLQASGTSQHSDDVVNQLNIQHQGLVQDNFQFVDENKVVLSQEYSVIKQEDNSDKEHFQDSSQQLEHLKNMITLPEGLHAMNIKKDAEGNVIIEVSGQEIAGSAEDANVVIESHDALDIEQDIESNLQISCPAETSVSQQLVQTSDGEIVLHGMPTFHETSARECSGSQIQPVEVTSSPYAPNLHQDLYQIGPDGTLQHVVQSGVIQSDDIQIIQDTGIQVIQGEKALKMINSEDGNIHLVEDTTSTATGEHI